MRLLISNESDCEKFKKELEYFRDFLYKKYFPNNDEREPFESIISRIQEKVYPKTKVLLEVRKGKVIGGIVTDYLDDNIAQPVYLAVKEKYRRKGIGRSLLEETIEGFEHVFLEIDDPSKVSCKETCR